MRSTKSSSTHKQQCVSYLAALFLFTLLSANPALAATNVLTNPGYESGTLAGWTTFYTPSCAANCNGGAVESTNNTYYNGGLPGGSNILTHAGIYAGKEYGQFIGGGNTSGMYQDAVAGVGSIWSAGGWALTHHQDQLSGGNTVWLEVSFRNAANEILALYKSSVIDASLTPDAYVYLAVTNQIDIADPSYSTITNTVASYSAPAGTTKVRFQVVFVQTGYDGGSVYFDDLELSKIAGSDPDILASPVSQTKVEGQTVTFSVSAVGATTLGYQWKKDGTNLVNGGAVSGATNASLTISNLTSANAGNYTVEVTDNAGMVESTAAVLTIVTAAQASNVLMNPGFETGTEAPAWTRFNGGGLATTNNTYNATAEPVRVHSGNYVSQTFGGAEWNGIFQDRNASPGDIFTADGWFQVAAEDPLFGNYDAWLEVQFMNAGGGMLALYRSAVLNATTPTSTWLNLAATNIIAFWSDYSVAGTAKYLVAPADTAKVRYQVTFHAPPGGGGGGSIWYDDMNLFAKVPATLSSARDGNNVVLSFATQIGVQYQILYKNSLTDPTWQVLTTVTGDGTVKTHSDLLGSASRFYSVSTL
jgi:hypothetical protein